MNNCENCDLIRFGILVSNQNIKYGMKYSLRWQTLTQSCSDSFEIWNLMRDLRRGNEKFTKYTTECAWWRLIRTDSPISGTLGQTSLVVGRQTVSICPIWIGSRQSFSQRRRSPGNIFPSIFLPTNYNPSFPIFFLINRTFSLNL